MTTGAAAALLLGGGAALVVREANVSAYNDNNRCFYGSLMRDERCGSFRGAADVAETAATVQLGAAAVAGAISVVLFALPAQPEPHRRPVGVRCSFGTIVSCGAFF